MADLADIRAGLAANLAAIKGCQVSAYMLDDPTPPSLMVVGVDTVEYDLAMGRGLDLWTLVVQCFTGTATDQGRQKTLDPFLAPYGVTSVKAAIESDVTLGGIVAGVRVARVEAYRTFVLPNGRDLFGAQWFVDVHNPGHS